ncbi:hypothetical protein Pyn_28958 [Prunus yedoensis var. nudiflora]|uniref:EF-hand domain-containing protein n=1 Tax=Prunus yedoensis var. nudiflora TaxID=2094558 RepID=A0A314Z5V4_PRUYE|nr:hypothetical protein Pyn_28958 [Prunus yedoensis var. nudiflora]
MAIKSRCITSDGKRVMTTEESKRWLKKFDTDKDGRISKEETPPGSRLGLQSADADRNGFIDEDELNNLVDFAQKHLGVKIIHL